LPRSADHGPADHGELADHGPSRAIAELESLGAASPAEAASVLARHPHDLDALVAHLHARGNAFVEQALALVTPDDAAATGLAEPPRLTGTTTDVIGLRRGDGMTPASAGLRPGVQELQRRLNAVMDAELKIDGMYGPLTGRATRELQASLRQPAVEVIDQITADALYGTAPPEVNPSPPGQQDEPEAGIMTTAAAAAKDFGDSLSPAAFGLVRAAAWCLGSSTKGQHAAAGFQAAGQHVLDARMQAMRWPTGYLDAAASSDAGPRVIGNPLVGLTQGDGLTAGTLDRRARVRSLQEALSDRGYTVVVDGKFGDKTRAALDAVRARLAIAPSDIVDADTADYLLGQAAHTPGVGNPDALRVQASGRHLAQAADDVAAVAGALARASIGMRGSSDRYDQSGGAELLTVSDELRALVASLQQFGALTEAQIGPVGLAARQRLRELHRVTDALGRSLAAAALDLREAGAAVAGDAQLAGTGPELTDAGGSLYAVADGIMRSGHAIAPVGPTGGGKLKP